MSDCHSIRHWRYQLAKARNYVCPETPHILCCHIHTLRSNPVTAKSTYHEIPIRSNVLHAQKESRHRKSHQQSTRVHPDQYILKAKHNYLVSHGALLCWWSKNSPTSTLPGLLVFCVAKFSTRKPTFNMIETRPATPRWEPQLFAHTSVHALGLMRHGLPLQINNDLLFLHISNTYTPHTLYTDRKRHIFATLT